MPDPPSDGTAQHPVVLRAREVSPLARAAGMSLHGYSGGFFHSDAAGDANYVDPLGLLSTTPNRLKPLHG